MTPADPLINFRLDSRSGIAPYRQLADQVRQAVSLGLLRAGDRLPSVREVVHQITINPNTVHRAYRELEHGGVVEARPGLGTYVAATPTAPMSSEVRTTLLHDLSTWVTKARQAGLDEAGIVALVAATVEVEVRANREP
jgi:GntR family transcriptional regulator